MNDLFRTKEEALLKFCKNKGYFSKADIMDYGLKNYYLRADRTVRNLVQQGRIRKLPKQECIFRGMNGKMGWYAWIG